MNDQLHRADVREVEAWVGWCCSYCAAPLEVRAHGLFCRAEGRFFATLEGVHRLLPEDRRREVQPLVELQQRARRDGADSHPSVGRRRARMLRQGLALGAKHIGRGPWNVLEVGGGWGHHPYRRPVLLAAPTAGVWQRRSARPVPLQ